MGQERELRAAVVQCSCCSHSTDVSALWEQTTGGERNRDELPEVRNYSFGIAAWSASRRVPYNSFVRLWQEE